MRQQYDYKAIEITTYLEEAYSPDVTRYDRPSTSRNPPRSPPTLGTLFYNFADSIYNLIVEALQVVTDDTTARWGRGATNWHGTFTPHPADWGVPRPSGGDDRPPDNTTARTEVITLDDGQVIELVSDEE